MPLRREPERAANRQARRQKAQGRAGRTRRPPGLFEQLRAWRTASAKEQGVPPYVVFHDATLREIAARKPAA